jgi:hypothetical protein
MSAPHPYRRHLRPVHGTCRWVDRARGLLRINGRLYVAVAVPTGYRLVNCGSGDVYEIDSDPQACSCPSFVWDHCPVQAGGDGRCKHIAALRRLALLPGPTALTTATGISPGRLAARPGPAPRPRIRP